MNVKRRKARLLNTWWTSQLNIYMSDHMELLATDIKCMDKDALKASDADIYQRLRDGIAAPDLPPPASVEFGSGAWPDGSHPGMTLAYAIIRFDKDMSHADWLLREMSDAEILMCDYFTVIIRKAVDRKELKRAKMIVQDSTELFLAMYESFCEAFVEFNNALPHLLRVAANNRRSGSADLGLRVSAMSWPPPEKIDSCEGHTVPTISIF